MTAGYALAAVVAIALLTGHNPASKGVLTNGGGLSHGSISTTPRLIADFPVQVENTGSAPVTLESATLVPLPGYATPRLMHLGVLAEHQELLTSAVGWPVWKARSPSSTWQLRPLRGYVVLPWKERMSHRRQWGPLPDMIEYGVLGTRVNTDYWAAGLRITYRLGGKTYTQTLYEGGADCLGASSESATAKALDQRYCATTDARANKELEKIAP